MNANKLLCVFPFCDGDYACALKTASWIKELGGCLDNTCLIISDCKVDKGRQERIKVILSEAFESVTLIETPYSLKDETWPKGANWLFRIASLFVERHLHVPFFWLEPDCIPLKSGWLSVIDLEYKKARKEFMGCLIPEQTIGNRLFPSHMRGCGVYPADTATRFDSLPVEGFEAWDILAGPIVTCDAHHTQLCQDFWGEWNLAPTFHRYRTKSSPRNVMTVEQLSKTAVTFHRCKDGSLIDVIRNPEPARQSSSGIFHVTEHGNNVDARTLEAQKSWKAIYTQGVESCYLNGNHRTAVSLGDQRDLPYLKDILAEGRKLCRNGKDIILFTNSDIILHPNIVSELKRRCDSVLCSFRINVDTYPDLSLSPSVLASKGRPDYGRDLVAMTADWLDENWNRIPDFLIGEIEWDLIFSIMARQQKKITVRSTAELHNLTDAELPLGYVFHQKHESNWKRPRYLGSPGKEWNTTLARKWYSDNGFKHLCTL